MFQLEFVVQPAEQAAADLTATLFQVQTEHMVTKPLTLAHWQANTIEKRS